MRKLTLVLFAIAVAAPMSAASFSFVKIGGIYKLDYVGADVEVTVLSDKGDGWYQCTFSKDGSSSFVNFNRAIWVSVVREPASSARLPSPLAPHESPAAIREAVLNNLRQLSAAADQYYLENGVSEVGLADLVGPTKYVKRLSPVDGEEYEKIAFKQGVPLKVITHTGIVVNYTAHSLSVSENG